MKIAFDAKRAYQNGTGLGHYSRTLIASLATSFPEHQYYLCAPRLTSRFDPSRYPNVYNLIPQDFMSRQFPSLWRSNWVKQDLLKNKVDLYHGLSHEIPVGLAATSIKSVVTIHDLIFERYPKQYNPIDVLIYRKKFIYACKNANRIIAISQQTKQDIIDFYKIDESKIDICYQSCNPAFATEIDSSERERVSQLYQLPPQYFLSVGSIIERKNLLAICQALQLLKDELNIPLVVIGEGGDYKKQVINYCRKHEIEDRVIFLSDHPAAQLSAFKSADDFPAIYQQSLAVIYPSVFEGFGIPVLEALWSKVPVVTSNISCLPETGGDAAYYVDPYKPGEIAAGMKSIATNEGLRKDMVAKGWQHAQSFTPEACAHNVMQVYLSLL